jgi:hypothetical protein
MFVCKRWTEILTDINKVVDCVKCHWNHKHYYSIARKLLGHTTTIPSKGTINKLLWDKSQNNMRHFELFCDTYDQNTWKYIPQLEYKHIATYMKTHDIRDVSALFIRGCLNVNNKSINANNSVDVNNKSINVNNNSINVNGIIIRLEDKNFNTNHVKLKIIYQLIRWRMEEKDVICSLAPLLKCYEENTMSASLIDNIIDNKYIKLKYEMYKSLGACGFPYIERYVQDYNINKYIKKPKQINTMWTFTIDKIYILKLTIKGIFKEKSFTSFGSSSHKCFW